MEVMVLGKCMVQTSYGDNGQKGMVGMAKDVIDTILELYPEGMPDVPVGMQRSHG
jgi:hypothetical protein